jgi:hypothetical protein
MMRRRGAPELPVTTPTSKGNDASSYGGNKKPRRRRRISSCCCCFSCLLTTIGLLLAANVAVRMVWANLGEHHKHSVQEKIIHYQAKYEQGLETVAELSEKAKAMLGNTMDYANKPGVQQLFDKKPAAVNNEYIVFLTASNGRQTFVQMGSSLVSPVFAMKAAQAKLPRKTNAFSFIKIDIVTGVKRYEDFNYLTPLDDTPSIFFGIALNWENGWVFLGDEVNAASMVDSHSIVRWERIAHYATQRRKLSTWAIPDYNDDSTTVDVLDVFHTESIFLSLDATDMYTVALYHGHRMFPIITADLVLNAAKEAGSYLASSVKDTGRMVYKYNPRSDYEPFGYSLGRHAGTLYSMACLYSVAPNDFLLDSVKLGMNYLKMQIQDFPVPYNKEVTAKCVVDYEHGDHSISKLDANALAVLAIAEFLHTTKDQQDDWMELAKSLATFIMGSQREDSSFCQKVKLNGKSGMELDETYFVGYATGEVTFALTRLDTVTKAMGSKYTNEKYLATATKAAHWIVAQESKVDDADFTVDHWLLYAIAEMAIAADDILVDHAMRTVKVARHFQNAEMKNEDELDQVGIYYEDFSATASATKAEGLCAVYELSIAKDKLESAAIIMESVRLSLRYQLQTQYRPEQAIYMRDPNRILGGFHESIAESKMRMDYTQHNLSSLLCMKRMLDLDARNLNSGKGIKAPSPAPVLE